MNTQVIRNVRPMGTAAVDVLINTSVIEAVLPAGSASPELPCLIDGQGAAGIAGLWAASDGYGLQGEGGCGCGGGK